MMSKVMIQNSLLQKDKSGLNMWTIPPMVDTLE